MERQKTLVIAGAGATATAAAALAWGLSRPHRTEFGVLRTAEAVDLARYAGRWFELARYPVRFERHCAKNATAEYALRGGGISIENRCTTKDGAIRVARGTARVADATHAKLKVRFSRLMPWADYWIIDLDEGYRWAVVGEPSREHLWILSRTPGIDQSLFEEIASRTVTQGYDPERLVRTPQDGA